MENRKFFAMMIAAIIIFVIIYFAFNLNGQRANVAASITPIPTGTGAANKIGEALKDSVYILLPILNTTDSIKIKVSAKDSLFYKRLIIIKP